MYQRAPFLPPSGPKPTLWKRSQFLVPSPVACSTLDPSCPGLGPVSTRLCLAGAGWGLCPQGSQVSHKGCAVRAQLHPAVPQLEAKASQGGARRSMWEVLEECLGEGLPPCPSFLGLIYSAQPGQEL